MFLRTRVRIFQQQADDFASLVIVMKYSILRRTPKSIPTWATVSFTAGSANSHQLTIHSTLMIQCGFTWLMETPMASIAFRPLWPKSSGLPCCTIRCVTDYTLGSMQLTIGSAGFAVGCLTRVAIALSSLQRLNVLDCILLFCGRRCSSTCEAREAHEQTRKSIEQHANTNIYVHVLVYTSYIYICKLYFRSKS